MKTFEIKVRDAELAHYCSTYKVEADTEEEAKRLVLAGEADESDCETYSHSYFNLEVAKEYVDGKADFKTIESCEIVLSDIDLEANKIQKEIDDLTDKLMAKKTKLKFIKQ
tara:strand:+ start:2474 stop:2806 length:333 start_codon:yes stop_codon:yes gene_type:complete